MKQIRSLLFASAAFLAMLDVTHAAQRDGVVVSIKPLHSLVSAVMAGVGEPKLIVQGAGSAHTYSMKPSDADALEHAKIIFWAGPSLETFFDKPVETLGEGAMVVELSKADGLKKLPFREGGPFEAHDHEHEGEGDAHGDAHDHKHDEAHEQHGHEEHEEYDQHFWLDPDNAKVLVKDIAKTLSEADPDHARQYQSNADAYASSLDDLTKDVAAELAPVKGKPFIVFHDAYQYFEKRFGVNAVGSITVSPEKAPGATRLKDIHDKIASSGAVCVFSEPQFEPKLVKTVIDGTNAKTGVLDPLGAELAPGADLYSNLIRTMAKSLKDCLS